MKIIPTQSLAHLLH